MTALGQLQAQALAPRASAQRAPHRCSVGVQAVRPLRAAAASPRLASFSPAGAGLAAHPSRRQRGGCVTRASAESATETAVIMVTTEAEYDRMVADTPEDKLLVVECSATWCGPCKLFKPAYEQFAQAYAKDAVFVTVLGDASDECKKLMTRLGVKSVPAFFMYKGGQQVSAFTGANKQGFRNQLAQFITL